MTAETQQRILAAVDEGSMRSLRPRRIFVAIPRTRGGRGTVPDMIERYFLRQRRHESTTGTSKWDLKRLREASRPILSTIPRRHVVGTPHRPRIAAKSLILRGTATQPPPMVRRARSDIVGDAAILHPFIKDGKIMVPRGRAPAYMKSGTIGALYALDCDQEAGW